MKYLTSVLLVAAQLAFSAPDPEAVSFVMAADRADCRYRCGDPVTFTVRAVRMDGAPVTNGEISVRIDNFGERSLYEGCYDLSAGPYAVTSRLDKPGFLRLVVGYRRGTKTDWGNFAVACDPEKVGPGSKRPKDFDAFWDGAVARLDREIPEDARVERLESFSCEDHDAYRISVATHGNRRVWGFFAVPRKPGKYPLRLNVPGAGPGWHGLPSVKDRIREVKCTMLVFDFPFDYQDAAEHRRLFADMQDRWGGKYGTRKGWRGLWQAGIGVSREEFFYYGTILGINRLVDWMCRHPAVDLGDVTYRGQSQGGAFGLFLAGLNRHLTAVTVSEPALTGLLAENEDGHQAGWPRLVESQPDEKAKTNARVFAPYFDGAHFATRITCPIRIGVGLVDGTCPPHCGYAAYNALRPGIDKGIVLGVGINHGYPAREYNRYERELGESWKSTLPVNGRAAAHEAIDFPFETPEALTVSALVKPEVPFAADHRLALFVSLGTGWNDGFRLCLRPVAAKDAYRPVFEVGRSKGGSVTVEDGKVRWRAGVWRRVTGVLDGRQARLFLDGREIASAAYEGMCPIPKKRTVHVGWDAPRWGTGTHPLLVEAAAVWNRALSAEEIAALPQKDRRLDTPELEGFFLRKDRGETVPSEEIARWRAGRVLSLMAAAKLNEIQAESLIAEGEVRKARMLFDRTHAELCAAGRVYDAANYRDRFVGLLEEYGRREALEFAKADYRKAKESGDALLPIATVRLLALSRKFGETASVESLRAELLAADLSLFPQIKESLGMEFEGTAHAEPGASVFRNLPAKRFFVAPAGDDGADGSQAHPFATLVRARDAVREFVRKNGRPSDGIAICLRGGAYVMRQPLMLTDEDSGTPEAPTVWCAWQDERPVLTGSFAVPPLKPVADPAALARLPPAARAHVRCCDVRAAGYSAWDRPLPQYGYYVETPPPITELYCDGHRLEPARYPNAGWLKIKGFGTPTDSVVQVDMDDFDGWKDEPDLAATGFWLWFWGDLTTPVRHVDPVRREVSLEMRVGVARKLVKMREGHTFFLLNALHALDCPGEWFLDRHTGVLYVWPPAAGTCYALSECDGPFLSATGTKNVRIEGLVFECGRLTGVSMAGCRDCVFAGNVVRRFGGTGMTAHDCMRCTFEGNVFRSFGHGALEVSGGDRKTLTHAGNLVTGNDFSTVELRRRTYAPHLHLAGVGTEVSRNHFTDSPSSAMRLEGNDFYIVSNLVENVLLESDDQGGLDIYRNATYFGNRYCWNVWRDIGGKGSSDAVPAGQAAVRFDGNISGQTVYANRFIRCGRGMMGAIQSCGGRLHVIDNNLFIDCGRAMSIVKYGLGFWSGKMQKSIDDCLAEVDIKSPPFSTRYPGIDRLFETDQVNRFTRNVTVGRTPLLVDPPPATRVMGNRHFTQAPDMRKLAHDSCLAVVPEEDEVGPLPTEAFCRACRNDGRGCDLPNPKGEQK